MTECWHAWAEVFDTDRDGVAIADTVKVKCSECGDVL